MRVDVESGFGVIALANGTYCPVSTPCADSLLHIASSRGSGALIDMQRVVEIGQSLGYHILANDLSDQTQLFTYNFWLDNSGESLSSKLRPFVEGLGDEVRISRVNCRSGFQGEIFFSGTRGEKSLSFQLAPFLPVRIQHIEWM
jgi:hypothetical protein